MENKKLPQRLVRNAGVFYVCHRLSQMGWNATPTTRYAKGPNVVIDSEDAERTWRLKVRSLSKRDPVPLGKDPNIDADWVVVCTRVREDSPRCYVLTSRRSQQARESRQARPELLARATALRHGGIRGTVGSHR